MTNVFPYQFIAFNYYYNCQCDKLHNKKQIEKVETFKPDFEQKSKNKYNFNAKPYQRSNKNMNFIKGYNPNQNACGSRCFNGCSNKSYKN